LRTRPSGKTGARRLAPPSLNISGRSLPSGGSTVDESGAAVHPPSPLPALSPALVVDRPRCGAGRGVGQHVVGVALRRPREGLVLLERLPRPPENGARQVAG